MMNGSKNISIDTHPVWTISSHFKSSISGRLPPMLSIVGVTAAIAAERSSAAPIRNGDGRSGAVQRRGWSSRYRGGAARDLDRIFTPLH